MGPAPFERFPGSGPASPRFAAKLQLRLGFLMSVRPVAEAPNPRTGPEVLAAKGVGAVMSARQQ